MFQANIDMGPDPNEQHDPRAHPRYCDCGGSVDPPPLREDPLNEELLAGQGRPGAHLPLFLSYIHHPWTACVVAIASLVKMKEEDENNIAHF